ncbi:MMPL family transporter [Fuerstiella marisgermanici]|uniref:Hopanoid biosynthesis associated RND transporter like protein HpnN n=1 Tax=Fuerstiella marisgermanici TaxID=1891926 RepID=A0A1P8WIJ3_9PLAN|nr:MMPL family transporter [Fuerstiella marisgermanici]APZ93878.1 hopanoid biosynthesis associated RND transporter like protein HpnN [Fuerstiella marisgermanici]
MASDGDKPIGFLSRLLGSVVGFGARRPRLALWMMVLVGCAGVGVTVSDLKLRTSRSDLLAPEKAWDDYAESFGGGSDLVVVAQTDVPNAALLQTVLDQLGERLIREPEYFSNVLFKIDQSDLRRKALQYLSETELQAAIRRVDQFTPVLSNQQWDLLRVERLAGQLDTQIASATQKQTNATGAVAYAERLATSLSGFLDVGQDDVRVNTQGFRSPWPDIVSTEIEHSAQDADLAYLMNSNRSVGMLHVHPVPDKKGLDANSRSLVRLREHLAELEEEYGAVAPDLKLSLTGIPVLEHDELRRSGRDMINAALIAFIAVGLLLSFGLKGMRHPMLVLIMLVNALAVTFGVATLAVGHLNILSICFAAIMIGLGVDFGIHFVTRYLFLRQELYEMDESLVLTGQSVGTGILTSALTTAIAFASAALTGYPGLAELGIIAAGGILICALMTFTFLPALIALSDEHVEIDELPVPISGDFWRSAVSGFPITAIAVAVIGIVAVAWNAVNYEDGSVSFNVAYDSNLLKLQDHTLDSVQAERTLAASDESLLYAVAIAETQAETDALRAKLLALPTVARVTELSSRIPQQASAGQQQLIGQLKTKLQNMPTRTPTFAASNPEVVGVSLDRLYKTLSASSDLKAHKAAERLDEFLNKFASLPTNKQAQVIDAYQDMMVGSLLKEFGQVATATSLEPVGLEDLPEAWRNRYLRVDGERQLWLVKIFPKEEVWNEVALASFVRDIRTVAPDVTGVPVQNYDSAVKMKACYKTIAVYSLAAIALFLLFDFLRPGQKLLTVIPPLLIVGFIGYTSIQRHGDLNPNMLVAIYLGMVAFVATVFDFRNLRDTFIALVPPIGGGLMLLGIMAILNVDFNPINLIVLPLVLGIGVDDGVHMVHDYRRQLMAGKKEYRPSGDTMNGVFLTSLTSIVGFGSLMISAHQGLKSVGIVLAIGVACCLAVALILVPPMLVLVAKYQPASFEPVVIRLPKKRKAEASDDSDGDSDGTDSEGRRLSRKERRRQQQQAAA